MPRDIDIRPVDPGIDAILGRSLELARQGDPMASTLGVLGTLPLALMRAKERRQHDLMRQAAMKRLLETGEVPEGMGLGDPQQAEFVSKIIESRKKGEREEREFGLSKRKLDIEERRMGTMPRGAMTGAQYKAITGREVFPDEAIVTPQMAIAERAAQKQSRLGPTESKMLGNLESGLSAIRTMRSIISGPGGTGLRRRAAAGTMPYIGTLFTLGNEKAQTLRNAALEAADVLTRARTGAQLNENEQRYYGGLFLSVMDTPGAVERVMDRYEKLFADTMRLTEAGKRIPQISKAEFLSQLSTDITNAAGESGRPLPEAF